MVKTQKKRLVFDLTEEEYNKFVEKARSNGMTNIEFLRTTWVESAKVPPLSLEDQTDSVLGAVRYMYIRFIYSALGMVNMFNNSITDDDMYPKVLDKHWQEFVSQIRDLAGLLEKMPPSLDEKDYVSPERPKWLTFDVYKLVKSRLARAKNNIPEKED